MDLVATIAVNTATAVAKPLFLEALLLPVSYNDPGVPKLVGTETPATLLSFSAAALNNGDIVYLINGTRGYSVQFADNGENGVFSTWSVPSQPPSFFVGKNFSGWPFVVTTASTNPSTGNAWYDDSIIAITPTATAAQIASAVATSMNDFRYAEDTGFSASGNVIAVGGVESVTAGTSTFTQLTYGTIEVYSGTEQIIVNGTTFSIPTSDDYGYLNGDAIATAVVDLITNEELNGVTVSYAANSITIGGDRSLTVTKIDPNGNITIEGISHPDFFPESYFLVTDSTALPNISAFQTLA